MDTKDLIAHIAERGGPAADEDIMISRGMRMVRGLSFAGLQRAKPYVSQMKKKMEQSRDR